MTMDRRDVKTLILAVLATVAFIAAAVVAVAPSS